jgi:hypothetical protein
MDVESLSRTSEIHSAGKMFNLRFRGYTATGKQSYFFNCHAAVFANSCLGNVPVDAYILEEARPSSNCVQTAKLNDTTIFAIREPFRVGNLARIRRGSPSAFPVAATPAASIIAA